MEELTVEQWMEKYPYLRNMAEYTLFTTREDVEELKKYELIRDILNQKDCFLNMSIEYAYSILRDLQIPESEIKNVYTQLISLS